MCEIIERNRREAAAKARTEEKIRSAKAFIKDGMATLEKIRASGRYTEQELAAIAAP